MADIDEVGFEAGVIDGVRIRQPDEPPTAAVLSVGSELLLGDLTDTNAPWISRQLKDFGVDVRHHLAVGDDLDQLVTALRWLAQRVHFVVIGGGLGPTVDDLTREAVAVAAGVELEQRPELLAALQQRFVAMNRPMTAQNVKQTYIPAGALAYPAVGTAPGFGLTLTSPSPTRVVALPGVPWEMRDLFVMHVVPEVRALAGTRATVTRHVHVAGRGESDIAAVIEPLMNGRQGVTLAFLAHSTEVEVRLTVTADDPDAAKGLSEPLVEEVSKALGASVTSIDEESLEDVVLRLLEQRGESVAVAESASAGDICARLARVPGTSGLLLGGVVVYTEEAKRELLDVPQELLDEHGAISAQASVALATAVRRRLGADWGIGVTGVAGPGPVGDLVQGTCYWALAHPDGQVEVHERRLPGDRSQVISRMGTAALDQLRLALQEG